MNNAVMRAGLRVLGTLAVSALFASHAAADMDAWHGSWDGTLYGYATQTVLRDDSVLNPRNRTARLTERGATVELRANLKLEDETWRLTARPIALSREAHNAFGTDRDGEAYLGQWQLRARVTEGWHLAVGRDVLNWGPAQFRSPSSPFYFDNGRDDPMRELVGMDSAKLTWTPDARRSASVVRVLRSGDNAASPDAWRDSWLIKFDWRSNDWAYGLVAAKPSGRGAFYGAHAQATLSDAWMLYGEAGSSVLANTLVSPSDPAQPFRIDTMSARRATALIGGAYTFEGGQFLAAELLHDGHGYTVDQENAYFQRVETDPRLSGLALGQAPRLLGRDDLHVVWQTNLMDERGHWRLMYTRNLDDRSNEFAAYGEAVLAERVTAFAMAVFPVGNAHQEFSSLLDRRVTIGLKIALP